MTVSEGNFSSRAGSTASPSMVRVSNGTPGIATSTLPSARSNHIIGAVPTRFCMTRHDVGTSACAAVRALSFMPRRSKMRNMFSVTDGSSTSVPPK